MSDDLVRRLRSFDWVWDELEIVDRAADRIEELEAELKLADEFIKTQGDRLEELQAKLTVAVETLQTIDDVIEAKSELFSSDLDLLDNLQDRIRTALAELKGQDDE